MNEGQVQAFLERYARAVIEHDPAAVGDCWAIPALVVGDAGVQAILSVDEVRGHFTQAIEDHHARGMIATKPQLEQAQALSERLVAVDVRWSDYDQAGVEYPSRRKRYLLRLGDDGQLRVHVSIARTT